MKRRLIRHGPMALVCGLVVYAILNITAWRQLGGHVNVCRRQGFTQRWLWIVGNQIQAFAKERGRLPEKLEDLPDLASISNTDDGPLQDESGSPIQYLVDGDSFQLFSYGRDRMPGGIGLDADLHHDRSTLNLAHPTLRQFFTERDSREVDRGGFHFAGLIAGAMVAFIAFNSINDFDTPKKEWNGLQMTAYGLAIVVIASINNEGRDFGFGFRCA